MPVVFDRPEKHCEKVRDNADLTLTTEYIPQVYITKERRVAVEPLSSFTLLCPHYACSVRSTSVLLDGLIRYPPTLAWTYTSNGLISASVSQDQI